MSTRGFVGFKTNNSESREGNIFGVYNGSDSYYSYLGEKVVTLYFANTKEMFKETFKSINWAEYVTDEEENEYISSLGMLNGMYSGQKILNDAKFLNDSLFCEYAYLYNLENDTLELYRGFFSFPQNDSVADLGYKSFDEKVFHTHHVYTITRDSRESIMRWLADGIRDEKYEDQVNTLVDGKYVEEIITEPLTNIFTID